jgi:hypothetical protein
MIGANPITALDGSDTSTEATVAAQMYETAVSDLLSRHRWRFAAKQVLLTLTTGSALARWEASFVLPEDVLVIHGMTIEGKKVDFDRYGDLIGANCLTTDAPVLDYGYRAPESTWPSYFDAYVELHLAAIFAYAIANQLDLSDYLEKKASRAFAFAKNQDGQGRTAKKLETSRFLQVRGFSTGADDGYAGSSGGGGDAGLLRASIVDGTLPGSGSPIPITNGGTGATTAAGARTSLGLGTIATQAASAVAITGGSINGTTIGATTRSTGAFTTLTSNDTTTFTGGQGKTAVGTVSFNAALAVNPNATGATGLIGVLAASSVQTDVTNLYDGFRAATSLAASTAITAVRGYNVNAPTLGAGASVTNLIGYNCSAFTAGTNNFGFSSNLAAGTGRWNYYALGTADNAYAGNSRFGGVTAPTVAVDVTGAVTATGAITGGSLAGPHNGTVGATTPASGAFTTLTSNDTTTFTGGAGKIGVGDVDTTAYFNVGGPTSGTSGISAIRAEQEIQSGVGTYVNIRSEPTVGASNAMSTLQHYAANGAPLGAGASITSQIGFIATSSMTTATNNNGFQSSIASGTGRFGFFAAGTADNAYAGKSRFGGITVPVATVDVTGDIFATASILTNGDNDGIGYSAGAGGTVTQITSRSTGVTINKVCGNIVTFSKTTTAGTFDRFTVTNSAMGANDVVILNLKSGGNNRYQLLVKDNATGSFAIEIYNVGAAGTAEALTISYAIIKAVNN